MRKAAIGILVLVVLVLAGLVAAPRLVDLSRFKPEIAGYVRERTGRTLDIAGPIDLALLPSPRISARDLRLANPTGAAAPDMVRLRALEVKLAFWPLLSGRVEVTSATLVEPEIDLEWLRDGRPNWRVAAVVQPGSAPSAAGGPGGPPLPGAAAVAIRRLSVQNGEIVYRSAHGPERFEHINAVIALERLTGPFHGDGEMVAHGASLSFSANGGEYAFGAMPLHLTVLGRPSARLEFDGTLSGGADAPALAGRLKLASDDAATLVATAARVPVPGALAQPLSLTAELGASAAALTLEKLVLDLGTAHATGRLAVTAASPVGFDLRLRLGRLDLDNWSRPRKAEAVPSSGFGLFTPAFAAAPEAIAPIPAGSGSSVGIAGLPTGLAGTVDIGVDGLLWRGDVVRQAQLEARLDNGALAVSRLAAQLPGGGDALLTGSLGLAQGAPRFAGTASVNSDDVRWLLAWLGLRLDAVPADRLRRAALSSQLALAGERLDLGGIEGTVDATRVNGAATVILRDRPGIGLRLAADRVNLDAYLPQSGAPRGAAPAVAPTGRPGIAPDDLLGAFDANLDARVGELAWRGQPLRDMHLVATLEAGSLAIGELAVGDLGGGSGKLTGALDGVAGSAPKGQLAYDLQGPEFERLLRVALPGTLVGQTWGAYTLSGGLQLGDAGIALDSDLQVAGGRAHLAGDVANGSGEINLALELEHPKFAQLVRGFLPGYRPQGGDPGAFRLAGRLHGGGTRYAVGGLALAIGDSTAEGSVAVALGSPRPKIKADLRLGDWQIDRLLPARQVAALGALRPGVVLAQGGAVVARAPERGWSREPIQWPALRLADAEVKLAGRSLAYGAWRIEQAAATATLEDGTIDVGTLAGTVFGGRIAASGRFAAAADTPELRVKFALSDADLKDALAAAAGTALVGGQGDVEATFAAAGRSPFELVSHIAGDVRLKARDGSLEGVNLAAVRDQLDRLDRPADLFALFKAAVGGATRFASLDGTFHVANGVARSDDLHLVADGGDGRATSVVDLPDWTMQTQVELRLAGLPHAPPLVLRLDGPLDDPRKVVEVNPLSRFLTQRSANEPAEGQAGADRLRDLFKGLRTRP